MEVADAHFLARLPDRVIRVEEVLAVEAPRGEARLQEREDELVGVRRRVLAQLLDDGLAPYWSSSISSRLTETVFSQVLFLIE